MTKEELIQWFIDRPSISVRQIGIEAGWKEGQYLQRYIYKDYYDGELVSDNIMSKILPVLEKYGYKNK